MKSKPQARLTKGGRPTRLTRLLTKRIAAAIESGTTIAAACANAGISKATFHAWEADGKAKKTPMHIEFAEAIAAARARATERLQEVVLDAAINGRERIVETVRFDADGVMIGRTVEKRTESTDPELAIKLMQLRDPSTYRKRFIEHSGRVENPASANVPVTLVFDDGDGDSEFQKRKREEAKKADEQ